MTPALVPRAAAASILAALAAPALAQEGGGRIPTVPFSRSGDADPLRFGNDEAFIEFAPFVQLDGGWASSSPDDLVDPADRRNGEVRRGRLYADFGLGPLAGRFVVDFADLPEGAVPYAWLDYEASDGLTFRFGQQDATFSFQERLGSRAALFAEDSASNVLQPADAVGAAVLYGADTYSLSAGVFGSDINRQPFDDGVEVTARGTVAPYLRDGDAVHLGLGLAAGFDRQDPLSFSGNAGTDLVSASLVSTEDFERSGETRSANLELAATLGRFTLESEYTLLRAQGFERSGATLHGGYLGALVFLTRDHRTYDAQSGLFEQVEPASPVTEGGLGALEIGARLDYLDLTDDGEEAGAQVSITGIANWYPTDQLRFTATHVHTRISEGPDRGSDVDATLLRAAFIY